MKQVSLFVALAALAAIMTFTRNAHACSCALRTAPSLFEHANVLLLVQIGASQRQRNEDRGEFWNWPFQTVEIYKGQPHFKALTASSNGGMCGPSFTEGEYYLVSTNDAGEVSMCSVSRVGVDPDDHPTVRVLNAYKSGRIKQLTSPWYFEAFESKCLLIHNFAYGGSQLRFFYRTKAPQQYERHQFPFPSPYTSPNAIQSRMPIENSGPHPNFEPGYLALEVRFRRGVYLKEGTARLTIDDKTWPTLRKPMDSSWAEPYEVMEAAHTREILDALVDASHLNVAFEMSGVPDYDQEHYPDYPKASMYTPEIFLEDALDKFEQCIAQPR